MERAQIGEATKDADFIEFHAAGQAAKGEFRCAECGYGVAVWKALPRCPMCGGEAWERSDWSPFTRASELLEI